jgi:LmbE family N-acetylglucosaminyl deacetylase
MPAASHHLRGLHGRWRELRRDRADARFEPLLRREEGPPLLLSPHLDDAVLDCWSVLSDASPPRVVNVFAGVPAAGATVPPWDRITGATDSAARVRERREEDAGALARAGVEATYLPLLDAQYRPPGEPLEPGDLDRALAAQLGGGTAHVLAPAAIGGHPDHALVRRYARLLLRRGFAVTLYADLPYCVMHGWPAWVDGREPQPNRDIDAFWSLFLAPVPELPPLRSAHVVRLDDAAAAAKLAALRCYETQMPALSYGGRDLLADPEIHRYEVFWELTPPAGRRA